MKSTTVALPAEVQVGPHRYRIEANATKLAREDKQDGHARLAFTHNSRQRILLDSEAGPDVQVSVLLHELLHAIWWTVGLNSREDPTEEEIIDSLAPMLLDVIRRNPTLVEALTNV